MPNAQSGFFEWVLFLAKSYAPLLLRGAGVTLLLALSGTLVGFLIGLGVGVVRSIPCRREDGAVKYVLLKTVRGILSIYIEVFRSTPMIVQAMVIYYGIAQLFALTLNQLLAGFLIVSVNTGAYLAEIVRGGIQSVDPGQREAAQAIGMTHTQTMLHVVLPQAIRNVLPALGNEFVVNIKDTSVLNVIGVTELYYFAGIIKRQSFETFQTYLVVCVIYFILTFTVTRLLRWVERKLDGNDSYVIFGSQSDSAAEIRISREA